MNHRTTGFISVAILFLLTLGPSPGSAFFEWTEEHSAGDIHGVLRGFGSVLQYPEDTFFYEDKTNAGVAGIARVIAQGTWAEYFAFEINIYQSYIPADLIASSGNLGSSLDVERSAALEKSFSHDEYIHLAVDRLNVRFSFDRLDFTLGRQTINLATTFYFTPNDFFAPFSAQVFYRVYKPGVDAARAEIRLGPLSQLTWVSVLGYDPDTTSDTGWRDVQNNSKNAHLVRLSTVFREREWALILGAVRKENVVGGSIQGELFEWLGLRLEGHFAHPKENSRKNHTELSLGIEHRWENSFDARMELFYHGGGAKAVSDYLATAASINSPYIARRYAALGGSYAFTPLLNGGLLTLINLVDQSVFLSINAVYSLSDESDFVLNAGLPIGEKPRGPVIESEFGLAPYTLNTEIRTYF